MFEGAIQLFHNGGPIMYPLLLCSLVGLTVAIERALFFFLRAGGKANRRRLKEILELIRKGKEKDARDLAEPSEDPVIQAVRQSLDRPEGETRGLFEMVFSEENRRMSRFMPVLDTIITLSPLLGILGTVLGIIESFELLGVEGARDPMAVTGGIARALITTAAGLTIAILMLIPFNFYRSRMESALTEIEEVGTFLETFRNRGGPA